MIRKVLLAIAATIFATATNAATIDFESEAGGYGYSTYSFLEDGFRVTYSPISLFGFYIIDDPADHLGMCGSAGCASNGTTALYAFNESGVTIDLDNGGTFSLTSLDVAKTFNGNGSALTLTLTATGADGVVTTTISLDAQSAETFSTFSVGNFVNISSLTIVGGQQFPEFAIDNVNLSIAAVPEPASWATLIAGIGILGGAVRRRRLAGALARQ